MFRVGIGRDARGGDGQAVHDLQLKLLSADARVAWEFMPRHEPELSAATVAAYDAIAILYPGGVTAATLEHADRLVLIARFGMGLEAIDLDACTERGVLVTTAPDAVREVIPAGAMALLLALAHRIPEKDRLVRAGGWEERTKFVGLGTLGRTVGVIGLGNVGRGILRMAEPFGLRRVACDPFVDTGSLPDGVELTDLDSLLGEADFVCVAAPLTPETHHLLDAGRLALMRPGAYLINVTRGGIVDTGALVAALRDGHLAGAGLDVFETEPVAPDHPLLSMENVILSPHAVGYTDSAFRGIGGTACRNVLALAHRKLPEHIANPAALMHPRHRALRDRA
jgi:phosphoglycerate dehydrogenase-like enzyme